MRIEPPMSEPSPTGEAPLPTAAPSPPDDPPAVRPGSYGLRVRPYTRFSASTHRHSSDVLVTPSRIAPASSSRRAVGADPVASLPRRAATPAVCGMPATATDSLIVNGTPSRGGN